MNNHLCSIKLDLLERHIKQLDRAKTPGFLYYPSILQSSINIFQKGFKGVVAFAAKVNTHPIIATDLIRFGMHDFDIASVQEAAMIKACHGRAKEMVEGDDVGDVDDVDKVGDDLNDANDVPRMMFMHPVKKRMDIFTAYHQFGARDFVVDYVSELDKIIGIFAAGQRADITVFVRFQTPNFGSSFHLSDKFGASMHDAASLCVAVLKAGFKLGVTFHVGSLCHQGNAWEEAVTEVKKVTSSLGEHAISAIDLGGGFINEGHQNEDDLALDAQLDRLSALCAIWRDDTSDSSVGMQTRFYIEPGRALVGDCMDLWCSVVQKRDDALFIDDGIYHNLSEAHYAGLSFPVTILRDGKIYYSDLRADNKGMGAGASQAIADLKPYKIYGVTCCSMDVVSKSTLLPTDIQEDDQIIFHHTGAYSCVLATPFNGFACDHWVVME